MKNEKNLKNERPDDIEVATNTTIHHTNKFGRVIGQNFGSILLSSYFSLCTPAHCFPQPGTNGIPILRERRNLQRAALFFY